MCEFIVFVVFISLICFFFIFGCVLVGFRGLYMKREFVNESIFRGCGFKVGFRRGGGGVWYI